MKQVARVEAGGGSTTPEDEENHHVFSSVVRAISRSFSFVGTTTTAQRFRELLRKGTRIFVCV